jgi:hypothetical protein
VGVSGPGNIFRAGTKLYCYSEFSNQLGGVGPQDVRSDYSVGFGIGHNLNESISIAKSFSPTIG